MEAFQMLVMAQTNGCRLHRHTEQVIIEFVSVKRLQTCFVFVFPPKLCFIPRMSLPGSRLSESAFCAALACCSRSNRWVEAESFNVVILPLGNGLEKRKMSMSLMSLMGPQKGLKVVFESSREEKP